MAAIEGYNHKGYHVFPASMRLRNEDGTEGDFYPTASVMRWRGDDPPLSVPYSWPDQRFKSAEEAQAYAARAVHQLIEEGKIDF
jgi:hypothetical protein